MADSNATTAMRDLRWSAKEKAIAHKAFDRALKQELDEVIQKAKNSAEKIKEPKELWDLERWLTRRRQEIDQKYDFRYSVLPEVFAGLLRERRLNEEDLHGLGQDKLDYIRFLALI